MTIKLSLVPSDQKSQLGEYLDRYLVEHSQYKEIQNGPLSAAEYIYFPEYWREEGRYPYFIYRDSEIVGFILIRTVFRDEGSFLQVSEFYILPEYRRAGVGIEAVSLLWQKLPGFWELHVLGNNSSAKVFWTKCCNAFAKGGVEVHEMAAEGGLRYQYNFAV
ncbi:MAG: hypothetical protein DRR06_18315 [Gammaproteobacteria bacterium]|nr:MAG: hypothetical protein DRR06_18315 [Gammaproteobacteria bacterium]